MSTGRIFMNWTGGSPSRGNYFEKTWSGTDASAAEKAAGVLAPHPYSLTVTRINSPQIQVKRRHIDNDYFDADAHDFFLSNEFLRDPWTSNHWNSLLSELYSKVKGGDFNASVFTAQLGETLGSIANAANRIYRAYRSARKGRLRDAALALTGANKKGLSNWAASKEMSKNWLELSYGWLPLLGDVHSSVELLANYLHRPITRTFRVRKQVTSRPPLDAGYGVTYGAIVVRHRAQIIAYLEEALTGYQTLGLTDPLTVAWELVPYSFVLDWFLPIGPWLEAANAARSLKGTFVITHTYFAQVRGLFSGDIYDIKDGGSYLEERYSMDRDVSTALSAQIPAIRPLGQVASSLRRCLNALALLENLRR